MATSGRGIQFGAFVIDPQSGELRKHGVRIRLQEQPFKILMALLEKPGEVVSREELRERIWGNDTFVDFDHGLSAAVNRLREALGDSADNPRFVETLARRGYRFIGAVEGPPKVEAEVAAPAAPAPAFPPVEVNRRRGLAWVGLAGAVVAAVVGTGLWLTLRQPALPPMRVVPLTAMAGLESQPTFSPDGKQVAFVWNGEKQDNSDIYVKMVGAVAPLRLTTDPAADTSPAWSPDGNQIAFVRAGPEISAVMLVSPLGGGERKLTEVRPTVARTLDWTPDGRHLALAERDPKDGDAGIVLLPLDGGGRRRLTSRRDGGLDSSPAFSPDGRFLAFASGATPYSGDVMVLELGNHLAPGGEARRLTRQRAFIRGLDWASDGRSLVYSASRHGGVEPYLWRVSITGSVTPERVEMAGAPAIFPAIDLIGNRLAYSKYTGDADIWKWEAGSPITEFLASTRGDSNAEFSPDGTRIAFASSRGGAAPEIWVCGRDGSNPTQLTRGLGRFQGTPRWSPDGRFIVFDSQGEDGNWDIYVVDAAGGTPRRLTAAPSEEVIPSYSRDGRWVYFCSTRSGGTQVWRVPSGGGEWTQMTNDGGCAARESWEGTTLYYDKSGLEVGGSTPLFAKPLPGGAERSVVDAVMARRFLPVQEGIHYIAPAGKDQEFPLMFHDFQTNKSQPVTRLAKRSGLGISVSPDRKTFLFSWPKPPSEDLMLIENFR